MDKVTVRDELVGRLKALDFSDEEIEETFTKNEEHFKKNHLELDDPVTGYPPFLIDLFIAILSGEDVHRRFVHE